MGLIFNLRMCDEYSDDVSVQQYYLKQIYSFNIIIGIKQKRNCTLFHLDSRQKITITF